MSIYMAIDAHRRDMHRIYGMHSVLVHKLRFRYVVNDNTRDKILLKYDCDKYCI